MRAETRTHSYAKVFRICVRGIALLAATIGISLLASLTAYAASVEVTVPDGQINVDGETKLELHGSGFQSVQGGFGGVYVLFGWVDDPAGGSWRPSQGGVTGTNYRYAFDDETNPVGYQVFVTFPGSSTAYAANGGEIAPDGTWSATITVPGARFISYDRNQNEAEVDCLTNECGIITIGAHGVQNANNETFTPVSFTVPESSPASEQVAPVAQTPETTAPEAPAPTVTAASPNENAAIPDAAPREGVFAVSMVWILVGCLVGVALVALFAGGGGYLAAKAMLLGVSPAALEREMGKRQRKADAVRAKQQCKRAKAQRKAAKRLARINGEDSDVPMTSPPPMSRRAIMSGRGPEGNVDSTQSFPPIVVHEPASLDDFFRKDSGVVDVEVK